MESVRKLDRVTFKLNGSRVVQGREVHDVNVHNPLVNIQLTTLFTVDC